MTISQTEHIFPDMIKQNMDQHVDGNGFVFDEHVKNKFALQWNALNYPCSLQQLCKCITRG